MAALLATWSSMDPGEGPEHAPPLGYRGVTLRAPDGRRWSAYAGVVSLESESRTDHRVDAGRSFEATLLASAPPELLPEIDLTD